MRRKPKHALERLAVPIRGTCALDKTPFGVETLVERRERVMLMLRQFAGLVVGLVLVGAHPAFADDTLRIAVGQRGRIFRKHGIALDILYTQGGGETQQAVISGGVELGVSAGSLGVFGAYSKGAPLRIIGAEMTGGADLFWYVRSDSPIRTLLDVDGKTIAYSTNG